MQPSSTAPSRRVIAPRMLVALGLGVFLVALASLAPARPGETADFASVDAGGQHTCTKTSVSGATCWGDNLYGQLGDGTGTDSSTPVVPVGLGTSVQAVAVGSWHSCAVTTGGGVKCWGLNLYGQLGDGTTADSDEPTDVCASGSGATCVALTGVAAISLGYSHTCAVTSAGGALCWGHNYDGEVGDGTQTDAANPVPVTGLGSGIQAVDLGGFHSCALTTAGGVKCWGRNFTGQIGNGTFLNSNVPVDVSGLSSGVGAITAGGNHSCALTAGAAKCWGDNSAGMLGDGTLILARPVPADVCASGSGASCVPLTGVSSISSGGAHTCSVMNSGGLKCWGWDGFGQLGDGTASFFEFRTNPGDVTGLTGADGDPAVSAVSSGGGHTCALTTAQVVKCWGWNSRGQLGDGSSGDNPSAEDRDFDRDGCQDEGELGSDPAQGGLRNPKYYWDFFDTPDASNVRDKVIDTADLNRVLARFGANDNGGADPINRFTDPLTAPPLAPAYHPAFDRGPVIGPNLWDKAPADGFINISDDIIGVAQQSGHDCR